MQTTVKLQVWAVWWALAPCLLLRWIMQTNAVLSQPPPPSRNYLGISLVSGACTMQLLSFWQEPPALLLAPHPCLSILYIYIRLVCLVWFICSGYVGLKIAWMGGARRLWVVGHRRKQPAMYGLQCRYEMFCLRLFGKMNSGFGVWGCTFGRGKKMFWKKPGQQAPSLLRRC